MNQSLINRQIKFKGFETNHINKRFEFIGVKSKKDTSWFGARGEIKNVSSSDMKVEYISFFLFNRDKELLRTNDYYFTKTDKELIKSGESRSFEFSLSEPKCLSADGYNQLECASINNQKKFNVAYFTADVHWVKELPPDNMFRTLKAPDAVSFVSDIKIEPLEQSYGFNKTAKLTYKMNGKTKTIFGNFGNMTVYGVNPKYRDVNNDGVNEVVLADGGNSSMGMNYVIMRLNGEAFEPMNVLTEIYDEYGDNIKKEYNDSGLRSLEIADFNNDRLDDLKSCNSSDVNCKIYYWNEQEELHVGKIMRGEN